MKEIVIASGNKGKIKEAQNILTGFKIIPMEEIGIDIDVEEDQDTFAGNAIKKAETIARALNGKMCIADDSGIEIEYLDGFPGVFTKRWHKGTVRERNLAIIEKLKGVPKEKRKIRVVTAIALSKQDEIQSNIDEIADYIADPMTATWFSGENDSHSSSEVVTSELIYYWMTATGVPFSCEKWHINRLLTLIKICSIKNGKPRKMSQKETAARYKALNAARRAKFNTKG